MKKANVLASVVLCLVLASTFTFAGDTHGGGRACPPETQCTQTVDPVTNLIWYIWTILT